MVIEIALATFLALQSQADIDGCVSEETERGQRLVRMGIYPSCEEIAAREARNALPSRDLTASEKRRIAAHFDTILKDGPSARWRWGKVVRGSVACLTINAKNSFGGYTGWTNYHFDLDTGKESRPEELAELLARLDMDASQVSDPCVGHYRT